MNLKLIKASENYERQIADMLDEWYATGEKIVPYAIRITDYHDFRHYCESLEVRIPFENVVSCSTFFCLDEDRNKVVGAVNIRHYLNEELLRDGGHIGDGVRPSERGKGIGSKMISLALEECKKAGIYRVLMVCDKENIASAKSIINNGGVLENEVDVGGVAQQRYWINLIKEEEKEALPDIIRRVSIEEIPECVNVIRKAFKTVADELGFTEENAPRFTAFATEEKRLWYQFCVEKKPMFVFMHKGSIAGYYSLAMLENGNVELNNLSVLPEYRHLGIGEKLVNDAIENAKALGKDKMEIGIVEENVRLRNWYEKLGFVHTGTKKFDFFPFTCGYMEMKL